MKITSSNVSRTHNIGDLMCSPMDYFDYADVTRHCIAPKAPWPNPIIPPCPQADAYIFGGGGIENMTRRAVDEDKLEGIKIGWGLGQTLRDPVRKATETTLTDFDLVGSRDYGTAGTEWVPCVSCMSPLFDKQYEEEHDVVYYVNIGHPPKMEVPVMTNRVGFAEAIAFLGAARVVKTDSYHGAYWASLLGKKVIVTRPYSSKFYQMKSATLDECREANVRFDAKVRDLLS